MSNTTSFAHQGSIGDTIASIPAMKEYYRKTGKKVVLYLQSGVPAFYYQGAVHPTVAPDGKTNVMLNDTGINMLIPLFKSQDWCEDCRIWNKEPIHIDLGKIRETFVNMPQHSLSKWYFYVYPDLACDLSKKWITVPDSDKNLAKNKIIVTRTERYLNPAINYFFLKKYEKDILFCGTDLEYAIFNLRYNLSVGRLLINNFLELAQAIKQCRFHISNQTMTFQISQGLKQPRILELCRYAPNVMVNGEDAYDFFAQEAIEYYVDLLAKKYPA